jgi:hypothetical protein
MGASSRRLLAALAVASLWACADQAGMVSPNADAASPATAGRNPGPPDVGLAGRLAGIGAALQVQDARLTAAAAGLREYPPDPCRSLCATLGDIRASAASLAGRVAELERLMETTLPPSPIRPPNPNVPPSPCQAANHALPPNPCHAGQLGSISDVLRAADARLAAIQDGFNAPPDPDLPAVQDALATIDAAARSLIQTADGLLALTGG